MPGDKVTFDKLVFENVSCIFPRRPVNRQGDGPIPDFHKGVGLILKINGSFQVVVF